MEQLDLPFPQPKARARTEYQRAYKQQLRAWLRANGLCLNCATEPRVNAQHCEFCRVRHNERIRERNAAKKRAA